MNQPINNEISKLYRILKQVNFFSDLSFSEIESLINVLRKIQYKSGKIVTKQGKTGDSLYLISKGKVSVWINSGLFSKKLVCYLSDNQYFGEMALLDDQIRKATVVTDSDCEFYVLHRDIFWDVLMKNPKIKEKIIQTVEKREESTSKNQNYDSDLKSPSWLIYRLKILLSLK